LARFVEALQGKGVVTEIYVHGYIMGRKAQALSSDLGCLFVLPLVSEYGAQIVVCCTFPWIGLNLLLGGVGRFV
jgi:hypothetical protein